MKVGLFTSARNEGAYLLEWIAYNRMIGFGPILVITNDCDDASDVLLDRLADSGILHHAPQVLETGEAPVAAAADKGYGHPSLESAEWLMWMDPDEFLRLPEAGQSVQDLVAGLGGADGICLNWKCFGDGGFDSWTPDLVTQRFTMRAEDSFSRHAMFKTLFRKSEDIRGFGIHRPFLHGRFRDASGRYLVNGAGQKMHDDVYRTGQWKRHALGSLPQDMIAFDRGAIHHYPTKTYDCYQVKKQRGQGLRGVRTENYNSRYTDRYWNVYNQNAVEDTSMRALGHALEAQVAELRALPGVAEAADTCLAIFRAKIEALQKVDA
ncbi:MAG: glycosyltransferase family 2 protein [Pseudomonadota bacterium]